MDRDSIDLALAGLGLTGEPADVIAAARAALARHGDLGVGLERLARLTPMPIAKIDLDKDVPSSELARAEQVSEIELVLRGLGPWKKGPFRLIFPGREALFIDAEWRSDLKWRRVLDLGVTFDGKRVLDVGTGNGYFLFRLQGAGASRVVGLEPGLRSLLQYLALSAFFPAPERALWPLRLEELPSSGRRYDLVMSMGVLYHQRDPRKHLARLRALMEPGGELVLETIVVPGENPLCMATGERYAGMRNVYVVPTESTLLSWLNEAAFEVTELGPPVLTTSLEQRSTDWAPGPSLESVLAPGAGPPDDPRRPTSEGHPRPERLALRAVARGPG